MMQDVVAILPIDGRMKFYQFKYWNSSYWFAVALFQDHNLGLHTEDI